MVFLLYFCFFANKLCFSSEDVKNKNLMIKFQEVENDMHNLKNMFEEEKIKNYLNDYNETSTEKLSQFDTEKKIKKNNYSKEIVNSIYKEIVNKENNLKDDSYGFYGKNTSSSSESETIEEKKIDIFDDYFGQKNIDNESYHSSEDDDSSDGEEIIMKDNIYCPPSSSSCYIQ